MTPQTSERPPLASERPSTTDPPTSGAPLRDKPLSRFRVQLGTALQKQRLRRGLTQAQLAAFADLSLKYVGEIERGEANTTLDAIERLAGVLGWDPLDAMEGGREPITEGIRLLVLAEIQQTTERFNTMVRWLQAIDPVKHPAARLGQIAEVLNVVRKRVRSRARPSAPRTQPK